MFIMNTYATFLLPKESWQASEELRMFLNHHKSISKIILFGENEVTELSEKTVVIESKSLTDIADLHKALQEVETKFAFLLTKPTTISFGTFAIERFLNLAQSTNSPLLYSDYFEKTDDNILPHPVIDYQVGSLRDDFDFGALLCINVWFAKSIFQADPLDFKYAALYYLRLKLSQKGEILRIPENLYQTQTIDTRKSGQKIFDYVNPKNREVQIEMEQAVTLHLKDINAFLKPHFSEINLEHHNFSKTASVIIPVRNRVKTIEDAVRSVFQQITNFEFNCIVIDNFSTDGTTEKLKALSAEFKNLIHIIPTTTDLGIGGCWNTGVHSAECGMFAIQLDSDDIYASENTLQKIVDVFLKEKCAMVVGTYQLVNFDLEVFPPGIIDHKEWTPENGANNALRINGLGAPRAFYTPLLRQINIPNVSYGEDYAVGLAISRDYKIGRIYDNLYLCRRWDDNSDAALDVNLMNRHNLYKDRIRTFEVLARINKNTLNL